jgi:hypothetical protein
MLSSLSYIRPRAPRATRIVQTAAALLLVGLMPATAFGQATRTWVSGTGDDANPCSRTAPCKTFAGAISKTAAGGEINTIDTGGFGAVTITKALTIKSVNVEAGVLVASGNAINVNAGANDRVVLYGLNIDGLSGTGTSSAQNGVTVSQAGNVRIQDSQIYGFINSGVQWTPSNPGARLHLINDSIHSNAAGTGVGVAPTGAAPKLNIATIEHSNIDDAANGIAMSAASSPSRVNVFNSSITDNTSYGALASGANAVLRLSNTAVTGNGTGIISLSGASIFSYGNNEFADNGTDGSFSGTITPRYAR